MSVSIKVSVSKQLRDWRQVQASTENVELYRILQNNTINLIADLLPQTNIDLLSIKGLGPKKVQKYGAVLLKIVADSMQVSNNQSVDTPDENSSLSVGDFISRINFSLSKKTVRVHGEIYGSVDVRGKAMYFKIKDSEQSALLSCFAWTNTFENKGAFPTEGSEVVLEGQVQLFPPTGRFSLQVKFLELRGEGLLKVAFEKLQKELEGQGAFLSDRKRQISGLPRKIAVVTAVGSDAEADFKAHIGKHGCQVDIFDVRVEGLKSESQIVAALGRISASAKSYDAVVITRGGGSLEALQAYNSKPVVEAVMSAKYPVISAVGHEKDITLCDLVADVRVSTPTDAGKYIEGLYRTFLDRQSNLLQLVTRHSQDVLAQTTRELEVSLNNHKQEIEESIRLLEKEFNRSIRMLNGFINKISAIIVVPTKLLDEIKQKLSNQLQRHQLLFTKTEAQVIYNSEVFLQSIRGGLLISHSQLATIYERMRIMLRNAFSEQQLVLKSIYSNTNEYLLKLNEWVNSRLEVANLHNPETIMKAGYVIAINSEGQVIRTINDVQVSESLNIKTIDGIINSTINKLIPEKNDKK